MATPAQEQKVKQLESRSAEAGAAAGPVSAWSPLQSQVFRALWIASVASNLGTWMQSVGAAWLMTSLSSSPALVALLQTATSLPVFLVGLPAGALADVVDRRKLLIVTQAWMLAAALALSALTFAGLTTEWWLLALTFLLGLGGALNGPAWQAIIPELVGRRKLASAVALNSAGFNLARAVGPALGGLLVAAAGPGAVFALNSISFVGVILVIYAWKRRPTVSTLPREGVWDAIRAGARYAIHAPILQAVLVRTGVYLFAAAALWALLPVVARRELGLDATGYGILLGSIGLGAVVGAILLPRLREALSVDQLSVVATLVFALGTLALGYLYNFWLVNIALFASGIAWIACTSSFNVAVQTSSPAWVRARSLGIYMLVFQGGLAAGSAIWGTLADRYGDRAALLVATVTLVAGVLTALRWKLRMAQDIDLTPSSHWPEPELAMTPKPSDGPVLVSVQYRVSAKRADNFIRAMEGMRSLRRRDGAVRWALFRDPADPDRYVETFLVPTWAEHLRQHERMTVADRSVEERAFSFLQPGTEPVISHFIAAQPSN